MKRLIFAVLAVMVMATPMVNAQSVNKDSWLEKLAKVDATLKDAKKNVKTATWINHAKAYAEAAAAPTVDIYAGMEMSQAVVNIGEAESTKADAILDGKQFTELSYPWFFLYVKDDKIVTWVMKQEIKNEDLAAVALASYNKAYEMDNKVASRIKDGVKALEDHYSKQGNACMDAGKYLDAAYNYYQAFQVQECPAYEGEKKYDYLYYAGYLYVVDGPNNPDSYVKGAECLSKALDGGYTDEKGDIYYYLFHCYYGQQDSAVRVANMERAKNYLMEGLSKFPNNDNIIDGLINVYTDEKAGVGNPNDLVAIVDKALERDPKNKDMWFGRGRIFFALKNYEESIVSFKKVVELDPKDAQSLYYVGYFIIAKADGMNEEFNKRDYKSNTEWKEDQVKITQVYMEAVPYLERAYEVDKKDMRNMETLKALTFRLRDEPGMQEKYEKYNKIYNEMKGN